MHFFIWKEKLPDLADLFCVYNPDKIQYLTFGQREGRENCEEDRYIWMKDILCLCTHDEK